MLGPSPAARQSIAGVVGRAAAPQRCGDAAPDVVGDAHGNDARRSDVAGLTPSRTPTQPVVGRPANRVLGAGRARTIGRMALILPLIVACGPTVGLVSPSGQAPTETPWSGLAPTKAPYTAPPPTPPWAPVATPAGMTHGRPYQPADIAAVIQAMPSFAPALRTPAMTLKLASAIASDIWTYDGTPYELLQISGRCDDGPRLRCDVFTEGLPGFARTRDDFDLYQWEVTGGAVQSCDRRNPGAVH